MARHGSLLQNASPVEPSPPLHYIATHVDHLAVAAGLEIYIPPMGSRRPWRRIYLTGEVKKWLLTDLRSVTQFDAADPIPPAQVLAELEEFCEGMPLRALADVKCLAPQDKGVWELKTPDVRLFGWFLVKDAIALHLGADKNVLQDSVSTDPGNDPYKPYIDSVADFRSKLASGTPCEMGMRIGDVLSNRIR